MLSYQHGYHAGTFADIVKHFILSRIISYMVKKDKPLLYLETHSGAGLYDLQSKEALKTAEAKEGIQTLWNKPVSALWEPYWQCIKKVNQGSELRYYPGSPMIAIDGLRKEDRMVFCELHPKEFRRLSSIETEKKRVFFKEEDGLHSLRSLLPPPEHRALIFMDPSYEIKTEYSQIPKAIGAAYKRFATGTYCLWYPIISSYTHEKLVQGLNHIPVKDTLRLEFYFAPSHKEGMRGCGLWLINPPFVLASEADLGFSFLTECKAGSFYLIKEGQA